MRAHGSPVDDDLRGHGKIARITLNRPERGNGITLAMPQELAACVERANLDPAVHVIALSGNGRGFCGATTSSRPESAEAPEPPTAGRRGGAGAAPRSTRCASRQPRSGNSAWDPMVDYAMMSRNVRGFMSLFHGEKPVVCKVHGFCVPAGTDMALCSDLLVIADDAKIGYPPARVWGSPTTSRYGLPDRHREGQAPPFTGDCLSGKEAREWGLAIESAPPASSTSGSRSCSSASRDANQPARHDEAARQPESSREGLHTTQLLGTVFDGITRHTKEGYAFQRRAAEAGFKEAVRERDEPFGDFGRRRSRVRLAARARSGPMPMPMPMRCCPSGLASRHSQGGLEPPCSEPMRRLRASTLGDLYSSR